MARKKAAATESPAQATATEPALPTEPTSAEHASPEPANSPAGEMSPSAYFRKILKGNPKLLKKGENDKIYEMWLKDHSGHDRVPPNIKQLLSNVKSVMRKERKEHRASRAKARKEATSNGTAVPAKPVRASVKNLEQLEEKLDDCLFLALESGKDELDSVIRHLRRARREVSLKLGL